MNQPIPSKRKKTATPTDPLPAPHHKILSIEVTGGFLDGIRLDFADRLNCIIGGRGTGKTTVLEFLRYGLNAMPDEEQASDQYQQISRLLRGNLGSGRIRIAVETKDGLKYSVERDIDGEMSVSDDQGEPILDWPGAIINAEVYSQNEIEEIANTPHFQLNLIDKFVREEIAEIESRLRTTERDLGHNADTIARLEQEIRDLSDGQAEIKLLQDRLKKLLPVKGEAAQTLQLELNKRATRDKEKRLIEKLSNYVNKVANEIDAIRTPLAEKTANAIKYIEAEFTGQDNSALIQQIRKAFAESTETTRTGLDSAHSALRDFDLTLTSFNTQLDQAHRTQEQKYQEVLRKHEAERGQAQEQTQLQKRLNELQEKKREIEDRKKALTAKKEERVTLLKTHSELMDERWECRQKVATMLNSHLEPEIRVEILRCGDRRKYKELLKELLKGKGVWYSSLVERIGNEVSPTELAELIQKKDSQELIDRLSIESDKAEWLIGELGKPERLFRVQTVEVDDSPSIQLKDGEYKDASALSIGQKCTTILPILLWESSSPLIVDQPEDNLDNNFIYETVVKRVEQAQKERQIIFVTHNPNIPVLGEASRVFALKSDGQRGSLDKSGTVDQVRAFIETFLEGGREAFTRRMEKYGIKRQ